MHKIILLKQSKLRKEQEDTKTKEDLINFVGFQFKQLTRKHLRIPIRLYNL